MVFPLTCASCGTAIPGFPGMVDLSCPACGAPITPPNGGGGNPPPTTQPCCFAELTPAPIVNFWNRFIPAAGTVNAIVKANAKRLEVKIYNSGSDLVYITTSHIQGGLGVGFALNPGAEFRELRYQGDIFMSAQMDNSPVSIAEYYSA